MAIKTKVTRSAFGLAEAAMTLGVCTDTLRRAGNDGRLRTVRVGRRIIVPAEELTRILKTGLGPAGR